jgi:AraC-like DNA-binding protein
MGQIKHLWYKPNMTRFPVDLNQRPHLVWAGGHRIAWTGTHRHNMGNVWCYHAYTYHARMEINGQRFEIRPGSLSLTPPFAQVAYWYGNQQCHHDSLQFCLPSPANAVWALPAMTVDGGVTIDRLWPCFEWYKTDRRRAEIRLWDELGSLAVRHEGAATEDHPIVSQARLLIEERLEHGVNVNELARGLGVTSTHLTRCFQKAIGMSCSEWMQRRRLERATQLLLQTRTSIKDIAANVGIPDLQYFNKFIRKHLGFSPRMVRQGAPLKRLRT